MLNGQLGIIIFKIQEYEGVISGFAVSLKDEQIAGILNYILVGFKKEIALSLKVGIENQEVYTLKLNREVLLKTVKKSPFGS